MIGWSLAAIAVLLAVAFLGKIIGTFILGIAGVLAGLWVLFAAFTFIFSAIRIQWCRPARIWLSRRVTAKWT
ncbi:MAG: hypothetical protein WDM76_12645 [Limisphaerales bacterium]